MASGLPTVCANATGSNCLVKHGVTGYLAEPGKPASFLRYAQRLIENRDGRRRMAGAALERSHQYAWDGTQARLERFYRELVEFTSVDRAGHPMLGVADPVPSETARVDAAG